ncbi:MAG: TrkH family potassium uptake protein [Candidatus Nezhaarchaeales archaeon]
MSVILIAIGLVLMAPIVVALVYSEYYVIPSFLIPMTIGLGIGFIIYKDLGFPVKLTLVDAMAISSIGWLIAAALSSIPYFMILSMRPLDAYFEAFSSLTATGMTLIPKLEDLPKSILFWRALGQWIGGAGVVLLTTLLLLGREGIIAWRLYVAEAREERLAPTVRDTVKNIWLVYTFYTIACAIVLMILGLKPFDALCHSLTCLSTGGFSTRTDNIGAFNNAAVEIALMVFMVIGAVRFSLHYKMFTGDVKSLVKDVEFKSFILILIISSLIVSMDLAFKSHMNFWEALRVGFFHTFSVGTTTGFTTRDLVTFPSLSKAILLILMIIGGCMNSTAGGIKIWRLAALVKIAKYEVEKILIPPEAIRSLKLGGKALKESEMVRVASFFFMYIIFALIATSIMMFFEGSFIGSMSGVFSAMATVGPFYLSPLTLSFESKIILIISMWAGRLELIPIFLLFVPKLWKGGHRTIKSKVEGLGRPEAKLSKLIFGC